MQSLHPRQVFYFKKLNLFHLLSSPLYNVSVLLTHPSLSLNPTSLSLPLSLSQRSGGKGSPVRPYLTRGIGGGIKGLSSLNLTPLLITCRISLLAPSRVLS